MFNHQIFPSTSNCCNIGNKYPDDYILSRGSFPIVNQNEWIFARFSPHINQEHFFAMGAEDGTIALCDAKCSFDQGKFIKKVMRSCQSAVFDFCYLPGIENWLISLSGDSKLYCWDIEKGTAITMLGHKNSVRCASIWHNNPYSLVTGARDGSILCWDLRTALSGNLTKENTDTSVLSINPCRTYSDAHEVKFFTTANVRKIPQRSSFPITGLLHLGEHHIISASSLASSGIRIWDLRYQIVTSPVRTLTIPQRMDKESGISCLSWDRYRSSFFATCTDNSIYEYMPSVNTDLPVRTLDGKNIDSFFIQCSASPVSDHLICGSSYRQAFIWDLQETKKYKSNLMGYVSRPKTATADSSDYDHLPEPKFALDGHENEVECVQWSHQGNYLLTIGQDCLRIWSNWALKDEKEYPTEILVEHRPIKLTYPSLRQKKRIDVSLLSGSTTTSDDNDAIQILNTGKKEESALQMLHNLPAIYSKQCSMTGAQQQYKLRTPRKITIKENLNMTPVCKIPRAEGHENLPSYRTPRSARNLTLEFRKQKTNSRSGKKRRSMQHQSPPDANFKPNSKRALYQTNDTPTKTGETSQNILKYFLPIDKQISPRFNATSRK